MSRVLTATVNAAVATTIWLSPTMLSGAAAAVEAPLTPGAPVAKVPLTLAGFASIDIDEGGWSSAGCIPAIDMALDDVNGREDILTNYKLEWTMHDTRVSDQETCSF